MNKSELYGLIKTLSDLGIVSDKRTIKPINTGPFRFKYPVDNFLITSDDINTLVKDNPNLNKYKVLRLILDDVIDKNKTDYFALMEIYSALAWAAFEYDNKDHFMLNKKRIHSHFMSQCIEQKKDIKKVQVAIIPDNSDCDKCKKLAAKKFEVDEFLTNMPIPVKGCTKINGICIALGQPVYVMP